MLSDRPEIELLPMRPIASVTVARSEFMNREYDYASPVDGDERLKHEYRLFVRTARLMRTDAATAPGLKPVNDYLTEVSKA